VDFVGANNEPSDLRYANFAYATLTKSRMNLTKLQGIDLSWTNFQGADLAQTILYGFGNKLEAVENASDYQNQLAAYLIALSCKNHWVTSGIIRSRIQDPLLTKPFPLRTSFAQCLISLKDKKNQSGQLVCPALSDIDENTFEIIKRIAAEKDSESTIQQTFECKSEHSDQHQETITQTD